MGRIPVLLTGAGPVEQVFEFWRAKQRRPERCKLTEGRRKLILRALKDHDVRDLCALVAYAYESEDAGPRFWRGENRAGRTYLDLTNLLSDRNRLPGRVESALDWLDRVDDGAEDGVIDTDDATALIAALVHRRPGQRPSLATTPGPTEKRARPLRATRVRFGGGE